MLDVKSTEIRIKFISCYVASKLDRTARSHKHIRAHNHRDEVKCNTKQIDFLSTFLCTRKSGVIKQNSNIQIIPMPNHEYLLERPTQICLVVSTLLF